MSIELLDKVERAEAEAEGQRIAAQREAREILKGAEEAILAAQRAANLTNRDRVAEILSGTRSKAEQEIESAQQAEAGTRLAVKEQAMRKLDAAAAIIFERVVNDGHR